MSKDRIETPANDARVSIDGPPGSTRPNTGAETGGDHSEGIDAKGDEASKDELTGRAFGTGEDLTSLFANGSDEHLRDGFRSGNGDDPDSDVERGDDTPQVDR